MLSQKLKLLKPIQVLSNEKPESRVIEKLTKLQRRQSSIHQTYEQFVEKTKMTNIMQD